MFLTIINSLPGAIALGLVWGVMAVGLFITYKILDFADLTVDGSLCTGAVVCAMLVNGGTNIWLAMLCALLAGAAAGLVTGLLNTFFGIPPVMSGILTQLMLWSVNLKITVGKSNVSVNARNLHVIITQLKIAEAIGIMFAVTAVVIFLLYWFFGTERGCSIRATGCNKEMSKAQGINTDVNKIIALMISNGLVALSGALLCQYQGFADINMGRGAIVIGLAAVIIGEAVTMGLGCVFKGTALLGTEIYGLFGARKDKEKFALTKKKAVSGGALLGKNFAVKLFGVFLGSIVYSIVYQTVVCLGFDTDLLKLLSAVVVVIFLAIPYWKSKNIFLRRKKNKTGGNGECSK
mgnify:FL=1